MVVVSHLFSFLIKNLGEGVTRYESHPPSLRTVYFPTAPFTKFLYEAFIPSPAPPDPYKIQDS